MNSPPRVLLIGRHFWPHGSIDSAGYLIQLATGLQRRGLHVEVLTPRYASAWAHEFAYHDIKVHRPSAAPRGDWSMGRYVRHLSTWLRGAAGRFDVLLCDSGREESIAAIEAARVTLCPSIVRISGSGEDSDVHWWKTSRGAKRCGGFVKTADRIVAGSPEVHRELIRGGFDDVRITRIDPGFSGGFSRTDFVRRSARRALGAINADLDTPDDVSVVACIGRMTRTSGLHLLAKAVRPLVEKQRDVQFWFVGDGPHRDAIYDDIRSDGVRASIAMPGSFSSIEDVLSAADFYVQCDQQGLDYLLPSAISAELPLVIFDHAATRQLVTGSPPSDRLSVSERTTRGVDPPGNGELVRWFDDSTSHSLCRAIDDALDDPETSRRNATQLRRNLVRHQSLDQAIDQYARLIKKTMVRPVSSRGTTSIGAVS